MTWQQRLLGQARAFTQALENTVTRVTEEPTGVYLAASAAPTYTSNTTAYTDTLPDKARQDLKGIWRVGLYDQKAAIEKLSKTFRDVLQTPGRTKAELKNAIREAALALKAESTKSIDQTTDKAIEYIEKLPEDQRDAAADYWGSLSDRVLGFLSLAVEAVFSGGSQIIELFNKIWDVDTRMEKEVQRAYEAALWLLD
ncbi:hypothetical protein FN846DRAFT_921370 [Sphaerosporella brunnea]|uniref:Uncharacterized protein n=1 Tax=Sphaerosporella brunnea TaxID=1250544 RepID=A0A5J5EQ47_9PEZI|nr:hypothetical protein FN846DRAFT_921370 [Sphaerosporella brunnea]